VTAPAEGVIPSPNIWRHPDVYELENRAVDPDGVIEAAMRSVRDWRGATVLDIGCGSGFHLPRFAADAARVVGVEPHPPLLERARRRPTFNVQEDSVTVGQMIQFLGRRLTLRPHPLLMIRRAPRPVPSRDR